MVKNQWFRQEWVQPGVKIPGSTWTKHATTAYAFIFIFRQIRETLLCMNPKPSAPQSSCRDYIPFAYERF